MQSLLTPPFVHQRDAPLAPRLTLGTGGPAVLLTEAHTEVLLVAALAWAQNARVPLLVLGGGSNLLLSDDGFAGLALVMALRGLEISAAGLVQAAAGEPWDEVVAACVNAGLSGIECLSGIPGSVGATPIQNVGAYGQEVSDVITEVRCIDRYNLQPVVFSGADCEFGYRSSRFKTTDRDRYLVTSVQMQLSTAASARPRYPELQAQLGEPSGESWSAAHIRQTVLQTRRAKSMVLDAADPNGRSCGSFFVNPIISAEAFEQLCSRAAPQRPPSHEQADGQRKVPAAWLIEHAGFSKGLRQGTVGLSSKHTLCVVAHEGATSSDVVRFAREIADGVHARFGVTLSPEPSFVGVDWPPTA